MPDRETRAPAQGAQTEPSQHAETADDQSPRGTPTEDRHVTETAGGQHKHDEPHTTGDPAKGPRGDA